jgi:hypothetical protein
MIVKAFCFNPSLEYTEGFLKKRLTTVLQHHDETSHNQRKELIMVKPIMPEISGIVLSSHQGLSHAEIVQDCLEKSKALLCLCVQTDPNSILLTPISLHQYLSLLDDLVTIALYTQKTILKLDEEEMKIKH